jgi:signal transduction histidine kinase
MGNDIGHEGTIKDITERKGTKGTLRRLFKEKEIVARIGQIISSTLEIDKVYELFAEEVRKVIPFDRIAITIIDHKKSTFWNAYLLGNDVPDRRREDVVPLAGSLTEEVMHTRSSQLIQTEDRDQVAGRFPGLLPFFQAGHRSFMAVPLISKDQAIAVLHVFSAKSNAYTAADVKLAESIGSQIAGAIANAQLYEETKRAEEALRWMAEERETVAKIGQIISSTLEIDKVYELFAEEVNKVIPFDRIVINIIYPESGTFSTAYVLGKDVKGRRSRDIIPLAGSLTEEVTRTRSSQLIQTEDIDEVAGRFPRLLPTIQAGFRSLMSIPLISKDQVIGVLHIRAVKPKAYTAADVELAESIGSQIAGAIANARLYAEQKRAEEKLKEYSERLEEMVEHRTKDLREAQEQLVRQEKLAVIGQLAGGVGHELRNPLGAIKNAAYFLNMVLEKPEAKVKESLEILENEVATSERIIGSLLEFARPKSPARRKVDINEVVREALSRTSVPENVEVLSQLDETVGSILADPDQLGQIFGNIILNALQAMPEGGRLVVKSEIAGPKWVSVSFSDTGVGIPEESLERLFEPLFTKKAKGIGLGLAIVKTLVEGHGGTIEVRSEVQKGSTFRVGLPIGGGEEK